MKIYIGADHRGVALKSQIVDFLGKKEIDIIDVGVHDSKKSCDYPKISFRVAQSVARDKTARGILVCMTGIGHSMAANRVMGARAALCYNVKAAKLSREHNNANILVLGSKFVTRKEIFKILNVWFKTPFEGGRHLRRVNQIDQISKKSCCK